MAKFNQKLLWLVLASVGATLAGCGTPSVTTRSLTDAPESLPSIMANGAEFKLGFDDTRYAKIANKVKPTTLPRQGLLPTRSDNRESCSAVANQGKLGSCVAFATVKGFREAMQRHDHEDLTPLSPLFMYYEARWDKTTDGGSTITDSMDVLETTGVAPESSWVYDITKFSLKPPALAYTEAKKFKYANSIKLGAFEDVQVALSKGYGVVFAYDVMESFRTIGHDGLMPVPKAGEKRLGGHGVLAVGYDNQTQLITVRNSWGEAWGDGGYFYMPYSVFKSNARDIWTGDYRNDQE